MLQTGNQKDNACYCSYFSHSYRYIGAACLDDSKIALPVHSHSSSTVYLKKCCVDPIKIVWGTPKTKSPSALKCDNVTSFL